MAALFFGLLLFAAIFIAKKKGFFILPSEQKERVSGQDFIAIFFIYLLGTRFLPLFYYYISSSLPFLSRLVFTNFFTHILTLLFILTYTFKKKIPIWKQTTTKDLFFSLSSFGLVIPLVLFLQVFLRIVLNFFHIKDFPNQAAVAFLLMTKGHPLFFFLAILMIIVLAPLLEEFLFRGYLQNYLITKVGQKQGIIFASLIFTLFHFSFSQKMTNIPLFLTLLPLGLLLGWIYEKRSLFSSILVHSFFNLTMLIALLVQGSE